MVREESSTSPEIEPQTVGRYGTAAVVALFFLVAMLLGATIYALGQTTENFRWETFRNGSLMFLLIVGGTCAAGLVMTLLLRLLFAISPPSFNSINEKRRLDRARRRVMSTIEQRRQKQEEQARLTAMMQASYLYEKESARLTNSQAMREFQKALQSGVVRSCEIVFTHLNQAVEQYEQVVSEIERSELETSDKAELLETLTRSLDVSSLDQRHRAAQRMMEDAVWRVRLRKARLMGRRNPESARKYLDSVRDSETSHRILIQIEALLKDLPTT